MDTNNNSKTLNNNNEELLELNRNFILLRN